MSLLVANCPRCGSQKVSFDVLGQVEIATAYNWQRWYEAFCECRHCHRSTVFVLSQLHVQHTEYLGMNTLSSLPTSVNNFLKVEGSVSVKDQAATTPPDHLPEEIQRAFKEGARCVAVDCPNAAVAMFRLCLDQASRALLPENGIEGLTEHIRRTLGFRMKWLFDTHRLPEAFRELSLCIREDGNDGAHVGNLQNGDAQDVEDFTVLLLERLYTEPKRLELSKANREARRSKK